MRVNILHAYLSMALGTALVMLLSNPALVGIRALALWCTGVLCWALALPVSILAVIQKAEELAAAQAWEHMKQAVPEPPKLIMFSEVQSMKLMYLRLPVEPAKLKTIAAGLIAETPLPFSEPMLVDKMRLLNQGEYRELKAEMVKRGLLEMKVPNAPRLGYKLSGVGRALMREIGTGKVKPEPTPLPQLT